MSERIITSLKPWGNSYGIIIPKKIIERQKINPQDDIIIDISRKKTLRDFFGAGTSKISDVQAAKTEMKQEWTME